MSDFVYPIDILSKKTSAFFREFTNKYHKNFVKVIINEDHDVFEYFVNNLIADMCVDEINPTELTCIDKFYILLCIRAYNVSPVIELSTETTDKNDKAKVKLQIDLNSLLQTVEQFNLQTQFTVTDNNVTVTGTLPKRILCKTTYELVSSCFDEVRFRDKVIDLTSMSRSDKEEVLNTLPSFILPETIKLLQAQDKILQETPVITFDTEKDIAIEKDIKLSFFSSAFSELIKVVFNQNLRDFYSTEYTLVKRFKFTHAAIEKLTPAEINVYYDIISQDIKREEDEQKKQDHLNKGGAGGPVNPMAAE